MAESDNILTKLHDLLLYIIPQLSKFPRDQKFVLGDRIEIKLLEVQESCLRAYYTREKKEHLVEANLTLEITRHLIRLAHALRLLGNHGYAVISAKLDEVGRMIGGWLKSMAAANEAPISNRLSQPDIAVSWLQTGAPRGAATPAITGAKVPALSLVMLVLFCLLRVTVARAEIGLDYSALFTIDTTYVANVGSTNSSLFTLDTRYGLGTGFKDSQGFTLDTRFSAGTGIGQSSGFTLDTLNASIADVLITGRVTDTIGAGLGGAVVQASVFNRVQASATADGGGNYSLPAIPAGTYQFRATKYPYITGVRVGQSFNAGQSATLNFSLALLPAPPTTEEVNRTPIEAPIPPTPVQLKVWTGSNFVSGLTLNSSKMTIVLTHGLDSSYTAWPAAMAQQLNISPGSIAANANIVAWDWENEAHTGILFVNIAYSRTPVQGEALGKALHQSLGNGYAQPIHFVGHSFGTLVNAKAANYLHETAIPHYAWQRTHVTLLDNAEKGNVAGAVIEATAVAVNAEVEALTAGQIELLSTPATDVLKNTGWISPVPNNAAWADNYISIAGNSDSRSVNIWLAESPVFSSSSSPTAMHSYAHQWYGKTVLSPASSLLGHRYSFERFTDFGAAVPYPLNSYFKQASSSSELSLTAMNTAEEKLGFYTMLTYGVAKVTVTESLGFVVGTFKKVGNAVVSVVEKSKSRLSNTLNSLPSTSLAVGPIFANDEINVASLRCELQNSPSGGPQFPLWKNGASENAGGSGSTNMPAYAWFTLAVPSNAVLMTFDFQLHGDGSNDCLIFGINGTNLFTLETRFIPQDAEQNSGAINVRPWAGTNAEFFVGLSGGTSLGATIAVDGIRFYAEVAPSLQIVASGGTAVITWPLGASDYVLESTTSLGLANIWATVTNVPGVVDFQYTVTNSISSENKFYRLRK